MNILLWEEALKDISEAYKKWFKAEKEYFFKTITKNSKILDIGCGNGRSFNDILNITKNITGLDKEKGALEDAKANFKKYPEIKFVLADVRNIPFVDNYFDFVICIGTFANFGDYKIKALEEMKRVINKAGFIIISVYSEDAFEERMKLYKRIKASIKEIKGTTIIFDEEDEAYNKSEQFSKDELTNLFKKAKLNLIEIKKIGIGYICILSK